MWLLLWVEYLLIIVSPVFGCKKCAGTQSLTVGKAEIAPSLCIEINKKNWQYCYFILW